MSKRAKELSALAVSNIKADWLHAVGGVPGLCSQIIGESRSWILRIAVGTRINRKGKAVTRRRDMGLGAYPEVGIKSNLLYRWKQRYTVDGNPTERTAIELELRKTQRELAEVKLERDMLKKAAAYSRACTSEIRIYTGTFRTTLKLLKRPAESWGF